MDVDDVQQFDIHESIEFQRSNVVVHAVGVVAAGLTTVEANRIDNGVTGAFLSPSAEEHTPYCSGNPLKPRAKHCVVRKSGEANLFNDTGYF